MRTVQAIPVAKVNETPVAKPISGGETIVKESNEVQVSESMMDESFVDIDFDNDVISNADMEKWMSRL